MSQVEDITLEDVYEEQVEEPEVETVEVEAEEPEETAEEVKTETEEPEVETTATDKEASGTLAGMLDEREKRQKWQERAEKAEAQLAKPEEPEPVSMFEDEKGYTEQQDEKVATAVNAASLGMSRAYAVREFGEEKVAASEKWYAEEGMKSPHAIDRVHKSDLKFHEAVNLMDEDLARRDTEGLEAKVEARVRAEYEEKYGKESEKPRKPITPSLASERSAGKDTASTTEDFEDILNN